MIYRLARIRRRCGLIADDEACMGDRERQHHADIIPRAGHHYRGWAILANLLFVGIRSSIILGWWRQCTGKSHREF